MASNSSVAFDLPPLPSYSLSPRPPLVPSIPDNVVALVLPVVAYWSLSLTFHYFDVNDYFSQYRLHTPAELLKRNHVSRYEVIRDVVLQHVVQTLAGLALAYFDEDEYTGRDEYDVAVWARRLRILQRAIPSLLAFVGLDALGLAKNLSRNGFTTLAAVLAGGSYPAATQKIVQENGLQAVVPAFAGWELSAASFIYWYFIPGLQFVWAIFVVDTWQYFLHRWMHLNRWLYVKFHSRHHRLYVPYAFGALYNHPVEGFLLDTVGTGIAFLTSRMTNRQSMWLFTVSTVKTVDDHCGYAFPWDPLQLVSSNNSSYHDIHHQSWGIKSNFAQPFFTFWDRLCGTQWKGGDVKSRYERTRETAEKKVNQPVPDANTKSSVSTVKENVAESVDSSPKPRLQKAANTDNRKGTVGHGMTTSILQA